MNKRLEDLSELLEALRTRHAGIYYTAIFLSAMGVLFLLCVFEKFAGPQ